MRRGVGLLAAALAALAAAPGTAVGQVVVVEPPFNQNYTVRELGHPPGVPDRLGGLTVRAGDDNTLLIGGAANEPGGALYAAPLARAASGEITSFGGAATRFADAEYNDGGLAYGPGGVLFLARWPANELGQTRPGSALTDKVIAMSDHGVASSLAALNFVPAGFPGAGSLKLSSYGGGEWYDASVAPDGAGTFDLVDVTEVPASQLPGSDGFVYVPPGSPLFGSPSMLVSEYTGGTIGAYEVDADGNPIPATRRLFISGLDGAVGAAIDPVTNDFLFSTFGGQSHVVAVGGFGTASGPPPAPTLGETANVRPVRGEVLIGIRASGARAAQKGVEFVPLEQARSIPVGSFLDTTRGTVALTTARNRSGRIQSGRFSAGLFQVLQSRQRRAKGLTELRMKGSAAGFRRCRAGRPAASPSQLSRRSIRRLRARARGRYRTRGRHSAATVRGTTWTVTDRCDGTLTTVKRGRVAVRDFRRKRTIVLTRGKRYLARSR